MARAPVPRVNDQLSAVTVILNVLMNKKETSTIRSLPNRFANWGYIEGDACADDVRTAFEGAVGQGR